MKRRILFFFLLLGCAHKPPTTSGAERKRVPVNSAEQKARLAFCADLGIAAASSREESPASVPVVPVVMELPSSAPAAPVLPPPPPKPTSYVMRVAFAPKSAAFKPSPEQVSELAGHLKGAERVEVRARSDASAATPSEEKLVMERALSARSFLVAQGVPAGLIWLNPLAGGDYVSENSSPEGKAENRRVEVEVWKAAQ